MPRNLHPDVSLYSGEPPEDPALQREEPRGQAPIGGRSDFFNDLNRLLTWIGIALLGIYLVTVLAAAYPVKLTDPAWINRICGTIRGGVSFPLEAMAAILLAAYLDRPSKELRPITRLRRLCSWVALGFVLMIPLQSWAGQKLIQQAIANQQAQLQPFTQALRKLYAATSEESLLAAMRSIPGAPPDLVGRFTDPLPKVRESLIRQVEPQVREREAQFETLKADIKRDSTIAIVKDGIVAFFSALGFAAIGRSRPERPTLLMGLTQPGRLRHKIHDDVSRWVDEDQA